MLSQGGAAATLGAARIIGATAPAGVEIHFVIAACENMVSGGGLRPGDVLTGANGEFGLWCVWRWCVWRHLDVYCMCMSALLSCAYEDDLIAWLFSLARAWCSEGQIL